MYGTITFLCSCRPRTNSREAAYYGMFSDLRCFSCRQTAKGPSVRYSRRFQCDGRYHASQQQRFRALEKGLHFLEGLPLLWGACRVMNRTRCPSKIAVLATPGTRYRRGILIGPSQNYSSWVVAREKRRRAGWKSASITY